MSKKITLLIVSLFIAASLCFAFGCKNIDTFYTVSFDSNGGTAIESVEVINGRTVEQPTDPAKEGYVFAGWYLGEEQYDFAKTIRNHTTLTAKWTPATDTPYIVMHLQEQLDGSYKEVAEDTQRLQGTTEAYTSAEAKTYEGFTAQEVEQIVIAPNGSSVVEIKYDRNLIAITWIVEGVSTQQEFKYGAMPTREAPVKASDEVYNYTFAGWDCELVAVTEEKTYTATFTPSYVNYTVVFKGEDGKVVSSKDDYHYGDTIVVPEGPEKASDKVYSYTFAGWNNAESVTGNAEYTATYTPHYINYTVIFKAENGKIISSKEDYHYGDAVEAPAHLGNHAGYNYAWDKEIVAVAGNTVYTETKTPKTFSVSLAVNGGELEGELTSYVYSVGATLPSATKLGHTFKGWYLAEDFSGEAVSEITSSDLGDKSYYAKWEANTYNVTLVPGTGSLEGELTSYVYGVGATLPGCYKKGYSLEGWYLAEDFSGEAVSEITSSDIGDKTFYAKLVPNKDTKYEIEVLVAQYDSRYVAGGYYYTNSLSYVNRTSEFASLFGLDENNMAQGETDSTVDLTAMIEALHGASLNAESVVSGVIDADESLKLTVKLDINEEDLGFKLSEMYLGVYSWENATFTLSYVDGACGILVAGTTTAFGKEIVINLDPVNVTNYASYALVVYDKGLTSGNKVFVNDASASKVYASANTEDYAKYSINILSQFPNEKVVGKIRLSMAQKTEHSVFIKGIEKVEFVKESVTYSIANENLLAIASPINGSIDQAANFTFANSNEGINLNSSALRYQYNGSAVNALHMAGLTLDLGGIRVSDYKTIKITFQTIAAGKGTIIFCGETEVATLYGGAHVVDIKAAAEAKGVTAFSKLELSLVSYAAVTEATIYIASIELVVDENAPAIAPVTYNVSLNANGGELASELASYEFGKGAVLPNITKAHHTFKGWYASSDFSGEPITAIGTKEFGNKAFYANFEANSYGVELVLNGGSIASELTSYVYGVGAVLPVAEKVDHTFNGWYASSDFSGEPVTEISASDAGNKIFYAKYTVNPDPKYTVKVLVAQYGEGYASAMYFPGALSYVDVTSEYASIFGLDENNQAQAKKGATVDLSSIVATFKGAKVNAESVLSGVVEADGSLELIVKLDVDEEALGFKLSDLKIGEYSCKNLTFTLKQYDGVWGLAIAGEIGNGKEIRINTGSLVVADYASIVLNYAETSASINSQVAVISNGVASSYPTLVSASAPSASVDLLTKFSVSTIDEIRVKVLGGGAKNIFIAGLEKVAYTKETVTYNIANGNLLGIASGLNGETIGQVANFTFNGVNSPALLYTYKGEAVNALHMAGLTLDLGNIKVSDYAIIRITFQTIAAGKGTNIFCGETEVATLYGGAHTVDLKAAAEAKGVTAFSKLELSLVSYAAVTEANIYIASVELVLNSDILCAGCNSTVENHGICEYCGGYRCVGDHSDCKPILCEACGSKEETHPECEYCGNRVCVGDHSNCKDFTVTLVVNGGELSSELNSYKHGIGVTLPLASKVGYTFNGWYLAEDFSGEAVSEILASDVGDKTFYAKFTANLDTPYSVKVLVASYGQGYASAMYFPGALSYVDATSEYASLLGIDLDALYGETDTSVELTLANLKGVKLNAESVLSGVIAGDGSLELIVKLDVDEEALGFKLSDLKIGEYSCDKLTFTLAHQNGSWGLAIDGTIGNGKEIRINTGSLVVADYRSIVLNYAETSASINSQVAVISNGVASTYPTLVSASAPSASVDLITKFSVSTIDEIRVRVLGGGTKNIFIAGLEKVAWKKETVTYSVANGNIAGISSALGAGSISVFSNKYFANNSEGISLTTDAYYYEYKGDAIAGMHATGIKFNVGTIKLSDYKAIRITFQTVVNNGGTNVFCGDVEIASLYGGAHVVDVKALAESKKITNFETLELSISSWANVTSCEIYVASIEFVLNPETVTYSVANGNIESIATPVAPGTLSVANYNFTTGAVSALYYYYEGETITADHMASIVFDFGGITVSDYATIKITYRAFAGTGNVNTVLYLDNKYVGWGGGGDQTIDLKAKAEASGVTTIDKFELTVDKKASQTTAKIYVASIELVVN